MTEAEKKKLAAARAAAGVKTNEDGADELANTTVTSLPEKGEDTTNDDLLNNDSIKDEGAKITPTPHNTAAVPQAPQMVPLADVQKMINDAIAASKEADKPMKPKKVTEHYAHVWRLDGKWVVDYKDRNTDPYVKEKIHAFNKFNEQRREFEAWIEVVFFDKTTKELPLPTYVKNRVLVYCPIIKRHKKDTSYVIGEVEKKKEINDKLVGTGVMIDQEVTMEQETFEIRTPDGEILMLPDYVIA